MADVSQVKIGSTTYDIKDAVARDAIAGLSGAMHFIGVSTTDPKGSSGATVSGHTDWKAGDVVLYGNKEYVLKADSNIAANWIELGDEGSFVLKTFSHTYQPAGTVSKPTFTGTTATISSSGSYTPAGSVSASGSGSSGHTFSGTSTTLYHTFYSQAPTTQEPANYQPAGTITLGDAASGHTFMGAAATLTHSLTKATTTISTSYQPAGTISKPNVSISTSTSSFVTGVTAASGTATTINVSGEVLNIPASVITAVSGGTASGTASAVISATAALAATPTFTGTTNTISITTDKFVTAVSDHSYIPNGNIFGDHGFTGAAVNMGIHPHSYTPAGSVTGAHSFTGTAATITSTASYQPAGTVSTPTFTGTTATLAHQ